MTDSETALEHLRIIRTLMEKATVYRAVSAPTALFGGSLALLLGAILYGLGTDVPIDWVLAVWLAAFLVINVFHHGLIWRTARSSGESYASPGLRMALKAIIPAMFTGGVLSLALGFGPAADLVGATCAWVTFYGLALLATSGFSPRSLRWVGFYFALVGTTAWGAHLLSWSWTDWSPQRSSAALMILTFGSAHLVYGLAVRQLQREPCLEAA